MCPVVHLPKETEVTLSPGAINQGKKTQSFLTQILVDFSGLIQVIEFSRTTERVNAKPKRRRKWN